MGARCAQPVITNKYHNKPRACRAFPASTMTKLRKSNAKNVLQIVFQQTQTVLRLAQTAQRVVLLQQVVVNAVNVQTVKSRPMDQQLLPIPMIFHVLVVWQVFGPQLEPPFVMIATPVCTKTSKVNRVANPVQKVFTTKTKHLLHMVLVCLVHTVHIRQQSVQRI